MNEAARQHLDIAIAYALRGDDYYAKCADEIIAARDADITLEWSEVATRMGRSVSWAQRLVRVRTRMLSGESSGDEEHEPDWHERGSHATKAEIEEGAEKLLADAPGEIIDRMVDRLPPKQAAKLATAALRKETVAREIAHDPDSSATFRRASTVHTEEVQATHERKHGRKQDSPLGVLAYVLGPMHKAKGLLEESLTEARKAALTDDTKEALEEGLTEIEGVIEWYRSFLASDGGTLDDELDKLLG